MLKHKIIKLITYASIVFCIFPVNADHAGYSCESKKNYIRLDAGYSYVDDKHGIVNPAGNNGAFVGLLGVGYIINANFRTDITGGYSGRYKFKTSTSAGVESHEIENLRVMLSGYWHFKDLKRKCFKSSSIFFPYLMVGIGYSNNTSSNLRDDLRVYLGKQRRNFAWQVGLGALFDIDEYINIDVLYKYVDLGKVTSGGIHYEVSDPLNTLGFATSRLKGRMPAHEITIGCHFKFN